MTILNKVRDDSGLVPNIYNHINHLSTGKKDLDRFIFTSILEYQNNYT